MLGDVVDHLGRHRSIFVGTTVGVAPRNRVGKCLLQRCWRLVVADPQARNQIGVVWFRQHLDGACSAHISDCESGELDRRATADVQLPAGRV